MTKKRNGTVDFWKFIFSVLLVVFHSYMLDPDGRFKGSFLFGKGANAVEFFLITSGFLMAASINKIAEDVPFQYESLWAFMKKKISGFYAGFLICWVVSFTVLNVVLFEDIKTLVNHFISSIFELLLVRNAGFVGYRSLPQTWYISAMIISMFIIYPIYRKNRKRFEYYIAPVISVLILGYLCYTTKSLANPNKFLTLGFKSTFRAFAEICLGIVCFAICQKLKNVEFSRAGRVMLAIAELFGYGFTIFYMQFHGAFTSYFDYITLLLLAMSVTLSFSQKSAISSLFSAGIFSWLGRYSLYPYLTYYMFVRILPVLMPDAGITLLKAVYYAATFSSALIIMLLQPYIVRLFSKIRPRFTKKEQALPDRA